MLIIRIAISLHRYVVSSSFGSMDDCAFAARSDVIDR